MVSDRRASSLASTLLLISICVTLAFTVVSLAFHHLNKGNRLGNSQQARNLAESAVSSMIEKILKAEGDCPRRRWVPPCATPICRPCWRPGIRPSKNPDAFADWKASPPAAQVSEQSLQVSHEAGDETLY